MTPANMKAKKLGRPRLAKGEFKGVLIGARFAPDEAKQVHAAVKQSGLHAHNSTEELTHA